MFIVATYKKKNSAQTKHIVQYSDKSQTPHKNSGFSRINFCLVKMTTERKLLSSKQQFTSAIHFPYSLLRPRYRRRKKTSKKVGKWAMCVTFEMRVLKTEKPSAGPSSGVATPSVNVKR